jgi:hypothetical protein
MSLVFLVHRFQCRKEFSLSSARHNSVNFLAQTSCVASSKIVLDLIHPLSLAVLKSEFRSLATTSSEVEEETARHYVRK